MSKVGRISLFQAFTSSSLVMRVFRGSHEPAEPQTVGPSPTRTVSKEVTSPDHRRHGDGADGPRLHSPPNRALIAIAMADDALFFRGKL